MSEHRLDELFKYLGKLDQLLLENERLKSELASAHAKVNGYRARLKDIQENDIANYKGALRQREDETHVLYHKISTLLGKKKPKGYDDLSNAEKRLTLHKILDEIEPTKITFGDVSKYSKYGQAQRTYTLTKNATKPYVDPVSDYKEPPLSFC